MYARSTSFPLKPDSHDHAREVAQHFEEKFRAQPGYQSATFYFSDKNELMIFSIWETKEDAQAVTAAVRDEFMEALHDCSLVRGMPHTEIGQIFLSDAREAAPASA